MAPRFLDPLESFGIAPLPRRQLLRRGADHIEHLLRTQPLDPLFDLAAFERFEPPAQVLQVLGFAFRAGCAVGVVFGFGAQDVAFDALAEAVHAAFFLGLAGGEVRGGGAVGDGGGADERGGVFVDVFLVGGGGFEGWVGGSGVDEGGGMFKGRGGAGVVVGEGFGDGFGEAGFGEFVFEALDHAFEGGVEELETS